MTSRNGGVPEPARGYAELLTAEQQVQGTRSPEQQLQALDPHVVAECAKNGLIISNDLIGVNEREIGPDDPITTQCQGKARLKSRNHAGLTI